MLHKLISHNTDLKRLWEEGYELLIKDGHLLIQNIPYVNTGREIKYGTIVSTLNLSGEKTLKPETHVVYFQGEVPCKKSGQPIRGILNSSGHRMLTANIRVDHTFSSKPRDGYPDYFEKMNTYATIISSPATSLDESVTGRTFKVTQSSEDESVFNYIDTNSTRAGIRNVSEKLTGQKIAIVGLGGTGSYILDLVSKNPVQEIHLYDNDFFLQHNAFRAPGAATIDQIKSRVKKVDYLKSIYSNIHSGIIPHPCFIDNGNIASLKQMDFVFICIDSGEIKKPIIDELLGAEIPFVDVGMGVQLVDDELIGTVRVTTGTKDKNDHLKNRISYANGGQNDYNANIQIAELNALNASLAVIKWKKVFGFYQDHEVEHNTSYSINVNMLLSEDLDL
ncbi:MAG: ThiF family adenylyltransferase [Roseivirga sp.]